MAVGPIFVQCFTFANRFSQGRTMSPSRVLIALVILAPAPALAPALALALALAPTAATSQVPTFEAVVGHSFGERITVHHEMARYLQRLGEASPRVTVVDQGASWEGRRLLVAIVTSPANHAALADIRANAQRLGDPRTLSAEDAATLIPTQPAIVWYGGSIHGFELSGSEGVLKLLEHLTTRGDRATLDVLDKTVILIDPMLNPDGRDAHAYINHENIGRTPNPQREDWANDFTSWQAVKFRTGHYYHDTNRDWFAHTQPEARNRIKTIVEWRPQFVIDMHEMGPDVEFYFDPPDVPYGPFFPDFARSGFQRLNSAYAAAFDSAGFQYMTRERYNYFYPGYTTSQGSYQGAVGMLYEQGSTRGLALTRPDGSVRTLADALEQQYLAAWTAAQFAATNRAQLLQDYYDAHVAAIAEGGTGYRRYFLPAEGDPALVAELVNLLMRGGVEVDVLTQDTVVSGVRNRIGEDIGQRSFAAGTYVVEAGQPRNRLIRVLLEPHVPLPSDFLAQARRHVDRAENPRFYDITAWSLPLMFNVGAYSATDPSELTASRVTAPVRPTGVGVTGRAEYAYLIDGTQAAAVAALYHLTHAGYRAAVTLRATQIGGQHIPSGTVVVRTGQNDDSVHESVRSLANRFNLRVTTTATGLADPGPIPSLGSADVLPVRKAEIAILAEDPVRGYSFGYAWHTLDRQYEIPTTVLRAGSVGTTPLSRFDVIVVPEAGDLRSTLKDTGVERLERWIRDGGTLVTIGSGTEFARDSVGIGIDLGSWYDSDDGDSAQVFTVPGAILRVDLDLQYWLAAGYADTAFPVLVNSSRLYTAPDGPPSATRRVVGRYAPRESLWISGHAWDESLDRLPGKVFLYEERVGAGRVIAFAEEVNWRSYWRGANRLFLNAVVIGPSAQ